MWRPREQLVTVLTFITFTRLSERCDVVEVQLENAIQRKWEIGSISVHFSRLTVNVVVIIMQVWITSEFVHSFKILHCRYDGSDRKQCFNNADNIWSWKQSHAWQGSFTVDNYIYLFFFLLRHVSYSHSFHSQTSSQIQCLLFRLLCCFFGGNSVFSLGVSAYNIFC